MFWVGCLAAAIVAVVLVARQALETSPAASSDLEPPCRSLDLDDVGERVTCRTRTATLTIAGEGHPLIVGGTEARVLDSELARRVLTVRMRLRNPTESARADRPGRRQLYVSVAGERTYPLPLIDRRTDEGTRTIRLRFPLTSRSARKLRRDKARAELGVVPWQEIGDDDPGRLGVIRLAPA